MNANARGTALLPRIAGAGAVMWAAATLTFAALHAMPGNPVMAILGGDGAVATPAAIAAATREYGLDRPLPVQYARYLWRLLHGDLGNSYLQHVPVAAILRTQAPATFELLVASLATAWMIALASVLLTVRRGPRRSAAASCLETIASSVPQFWLGILLLALFAFRLEWLPPAGSRGVSTLILPMLALGIPLGGFLAQVMREGMEIAFDEPFVLSARARGLGEWPLRLHHVLRHSLLPAISLSGWAVAALIGGTVAVETVFSRRGLGRQLVGAVGSHDLPLVTGITLVAATVCIAANMAVDLLHALVDPRLQRNRT